mgnify:CR=1 FL=1
MSDLEDYTPFEDKYGIELILDLHDCDVSTFTRDSISDYFAQLCDLIDMKREDLHFWDDVGLDEEDKQTSPHTQGTSAVQFILTSSIVIHALLLPPGGTNDLSTARGRLVV